MTDPSPAPPVVEELLELLNSWERHLRAADLSPGTLRTYRQSIQAFGRHLAALPDPPGSVEEIRRPLLEDWLFALKESGASGWTVLTRFANLRTFMIWLVEEGELKSPPTKGMRDPKVVQQPVAVVAPDALRLMLDGCDNGFEGRRDEALIRAFSDGGMRVSETAMLLLADADMDQQVFWVRGKGGRLRAVPFGSKTARAVDRYLRARRKHTKTDESDRLWLGGKGPLTADGIRLMVGRRSERAGLGHLHPHQLRHTAAHQLRKAGMNDQDMKRIFGWRSNKMLERYGESAADERALEAHRRLSFGEQL